MKDPRIPFENHMSKAQVILGLVYLPIHIFLLPWLLLPLLALVMPELDDGMINLVYYAVGGVFVLAVFWRYLRVHFDAFLDRIGWCLLTMLMTLGLEYFLSYAVSTIIFAFPDLFTANPNDEAIMEIAEISYGPVKAVTIFLAPIVEEVLFRGVVFGSIRQRSRTAAYVVSILVFSVYHVWQYALAYADWTQLVYIIQYIPASFALAWCYERSGSIWAPIAFHMGVNAMSFYVLNMLM